MVGKVISHYRILEKLGEGGMGVVYKAEDTKLKRTVALKFLPPGLAKDIEGKERFMHEAQAISKLNHPHIATIHDLVEADGYEFIVLEYIEGGTLRDKIGKRNHGSPLPMKEVISYAVQIAEGLSYAHKREIVHRDIKTDNIMLTNDGQVKITDFGLAKLKDATKVTKTGSTVGTAAYMSPEQACRGTVDHRSDIFSFGVVLYEMVTGELPFKGEHEPAILYEIVNIEPESMRFLQPDVPPEFEMIVRKAMSKDVNHRYQSVEDLLQDTRAFRDGLKPKISIKHKRKWLIPSLIIFGIIVLCAVWFVVSGKREIQTPIKTVSDDLSSTMKLQRKSVAVVGFRNLSRQTDDSWISTALSEMLTTELSAGNQMRTIPGENVSRMKIDLSLSDAESFAKETLNKIRNVLGTDYIVIGSYLAARGRGDRQIRVDLRIQDVGIGETVASIAEVGMESEIFDLVAKVGSVLRDKLGIRNVTTADVAALRASYQTTDEAIRLYAEGLDKLRLFDALKAKTLFTKAISLDSTYPHVRSALAEAWNTLGFKENAKTEAKKAFEFSGNVRKEDKMLIEGRYREYSREWDQAAGIYKKLWSIEPDNTDFGIRLANVYKKARRAKDILEIVNKLRAGKLYPSDDVQVDLLEAEACKLLSENQRGKSLCDSAVIKAEKQGIRVLLAEAIRTKADLLLNLDLYDSASVLVNRAKQMYSEIGNRFGEASSILIYAQALRSKGEPAKAKSLLSEAAAIFDGIGAKGQKSIPMIMEGVCFMDMNKYDSARIVYEKSLKILKKMNDQYNIALCLNYYGINDRFMGKNDDALKKFEDVEARWKEIGNKEGVAHALNNIALILYDKGNFEEARKKYAEAEAIFKEIGLKRGIILTLFNSAELESDLGDLRNSTKKFEEALSIAREIQAKRTMSSILYSLGNNYYLRGDLRNARQAQEEALSIATEMGGQLRIADRLMMLVDLDRVEGNLQRSEINARKTLALYQEGKATNGQIRSYYTIAWVLLLQNRLQEARTEVDSALQFLVQHKNDAYQVHASTISAKILAGEGYYDKAILEIDSMIQLAKKSKTLECEYNARIALGEVMMKAGKLDTGAAVLNNLEKDAESHDYGLFSNMARKILQRHNH